jgi:hypothetical protein
VVKSNSLRAVCQDAGGGKCASWDLRTSGPSILGNSESPQTPIPPRARMRLLGSALRAGQLDRVDDRTCVQFWGRRSVHFRSNRRLMFTPTLIQDRRHSAGVAAPLGAWRHASGGNVERIQSVRFQGKNRKLLFASEQREHPRAGAARACGTVLAFVQGVAGARKRMPGRYAKFAEKSLQTKPLCSGAWGINLVIVGAPTAPTLFDNLGHGACVDASEGIDAPVGGCLKPETTFTRILPCRKQPTP